MSHSFLIIVSYVTNKMFWMRKNIKKYVFLGHIFGVEFPHVDRCVEKNVPKELLAACSTFSYASCTLINTDCFFVV